MNWKDLLANWKTTLSSILTVTLFSTAALLTYPPVMAHPKVMGILGGVQILAKVWIGLIQKDANPAVTSSVTIESTTPKPQETK